MKKHRRNDKRESQDIKYDINEYRRKQKWKKRKSVLLSVVTFVLLIVVVVGGLYLYRNYDMDDLTELFPQETDEGTIVESSFPLSVEGLLPQRIYASADGVVLLTKEEVAVISSAGSVLHNFTHQFTNPQLKTADKYVLTYDKGGYSYRLDGGSSNLQHGKMEETILTGEVSANGSYALVTTESNFAGSITVYDHSDREVFQWYSASDQIVDIAFSEDGDYLAVACVGFADGILQAKLYLLEVYGGEEIEKESKTFAGALPLDVAFFADNSIHMVCDNLLVSADKDLSEVTSEALNGQVEELYSSAYHTVLILQNPGQAGDTLLCVGKDGKKQTATVNGEVFAISDNESHIFLLLKNAISGYDADFSKTKEMILSDDVFDIAVVGENIYTLDPAKLRQMGE